MTIKPSSAATESPILSPSAALLEQLRDIYKDLHANPELSMQETRTAGIAARWLADLGFEVTEGIGGTGIVGVLRSGEGPTVLLRADMDALPIQESTGLPYASQRSGIDRFGQETAIAHSCGHDMHVAWLMGVAHQFAMNRQDWAGTLLCVFQPGEETGQGARAMIEDGIVKRFPKPAVTLAQHVMPLPAGRIGWRVGTMLSAGDSWEVTMYGRGAHGSMPQKAIDPVVMAASTVLRLQTIVSREVAMTDSAVVTVGALQAGRSENVIPDHALLRLNVRTFKEEVRKRVLAAIQRIVEAEADASGASRKPDISILSQFPLTRNDEQATLRVVHALETAFGPTAVSEVSPATASEDFGLFGTAWDSPSVFWVVGGIDPQVYAKAQATGTVDALPANHAPDFAPAVDPTLLIGLKAMTAAALAWLAPPQAG